MAYSDDVAVSEGARQVEHKAANTDAAHKLADQNHWSRLVTAGRKWGVRNGAMAALLAAGGTAPAGSFQSTDS